MSWDGCPVLVTGFEMMFRVEGKTSENGLLARASSFEPDDTQREAENAEKTRKL